MYLDINDNDFIDKNADKVPKQENAIPKLKLLCLKYLESAQLDLISMIVISIYTVFTLFSLTHAGFTTDGESVDPKILGRIDTYFLAFFLTEISLKTFASNLMYLRDKFNCFDAIIVILSFALNLMALYIPGLGALRLVRVVVIILRKITGNQSKLRHQNKYNNPVESVIKILIQITELQEISTSI
jgi:hypothetical protein